MSARLYHALLLKTVLIALLLMTGRLLGRADDNVIATDDNIIATEENIVYTLQADKGALGTVKKTSDITYKATRADDRVLAFEMFGEHESIDKASAPGVKPYYRSWEPEDLFHTGSRICLLDVPLTVGKPAKVSFATTQKWPQQFCNIFLSSPHFTERSTVKVIIPSALASRYGVEPYRLPATMKLEKTTEKNGDVVYTVTTTDRRPIRREPGAPSLAIELPQLIITGHFSDTADLYTYLKSFVDDSGADASPVAELSKRLTATCPTPLAAIDSVASWVRQNIRYVAIENGEYALRPATASEVLSRKYGDCKGSANLIKALLKHAGIDSRLVWVGTLDEVATNWATTPSLMSGNHQIACAVLPDTIIYIDGTAAWAPDGYIPYNIRGAKVLVEDGEKCMLTTIPDASRMADGERMQAHLSVSGNDLVGSLSHTYYGTERAALVSAWQSLDAASRASFLERLLTYPKKNMRAEEVKMRLLSPSAAQCCIDSEKVTDRQAARKVGDKLYIGLQPLRVFGLEPVEMSKRTQGLRPIPTSLYSAEIVLDIPEGYAVESLPEPFKLNSEWFDGDVNYQIADSQIICKATLKSGHDYVPLESLEAYNDIVKTLNKISSTQLILRHYD